MATYTTNYHLEKPDSTDNFGDFRQSYNDNMDIIDQNMGGGGGDSVSYTQVLASGTKVGEIEINGSSADINAPIYKLRRTTVLENPYIEVYSDESGESTLIPTREFASKVMLYANFANGDYIGSLQIDNIMYRMYSKQYLDGEGIDIGVTPSGHGTINLSYLKVVNGAVNLVFDDGN